MTAAPESIDWYERRDELEPGMVFETYSGIVKLDQRVEGDGTKWEVMSWYPGRPDMPGTVYEKGHWSCDDGTIEPSDLTTQLPNEFGKPA